MTRARYVFDRDQNRLVPAAEYYARRPGVPRSSLPAPMIMGDIQPYRSMLTGETIDGRRQHREHLRQHGVEEELGNEWPTASPRKTLPPVQLSVKEAIERHRSGQRPRPVERVDAPNTRMFG